MFQNGIKNICGLGAASDRQQDSRRFQSEIDVLFGVGQGAPGAVRITDTSFSNARAGFRETLASVHAKPRVRTESVSFRKNVRRMLSQPETAASPQPTMTRSTQSASEWHRALKNRTRTFHEFLSVRSNRTIILDVYVSMTRGCVAKTPLPVRVVSEPSVRLWWIRKSLCRVFLNVPGQ